MSEQKQSYSFDFGQGLIEVTVPGSDYRPEPERDSRFVDFGSGPREVSVPESER
jgi:hypothetical protein